MSGGHPDGGFGQGFNVSGRSIHLWAARQGGAGRRDPAGRLVETGPMKKRLLISALVFAALLLALYGVMFGTGAK